MKSTVSRVCQQIKEQFERWSQRRLDDVDLDYLFLLGSADVSRAWCPDPGSDLRRRALGW